MQLFNFSTWFRTKPTFSSNQQSFTILSSDARQSCFIKINTRDRLSELSVLSLDYVVSSSLAHDEVHKKRSDDISFKCLFFISINPCQIHVCHIVEFFLLLFLGVFFLIPGGGCFVFVQGVHSKIWHSLVFDSYTPCRHLGKEKE